MPKEKQKALISKNIQNEIKYKEILVPIKNEKILDKNTKILIRELDAKECELQTMQQLVLEYSQ